MSRISSEEFNARLTKLRGENWKLNSLLNHYGGWKGLRADLKAKALVLMGLRAISDDTSDALYYVEAAALPPEAE